MTVAGWLRAAQMPALLAIDTPLGWPVRLGCALTNHRAGEPIAADADRLFRRDTDRFIKLKLGKTPLDVGADQIARTAHTALCLLNGLRQCLDETVPRDRCGGLSPTHSTAKHTLGNSISCKRVDRYRN